MRTSTLLHVAIVLGVINTVGRASWAYEGCYYGGAPFIPLRQGVAYPTVDVWLDDTFYSAPSIGGIATADAERILQQVVARFQSETGASFNLRWRGRSTSLQCIADAKIGPSVQFSTPTIIIDADPSGTFCANGRSCGWYEPTYNAATHQYGTDMNCGRVTFELTAAFSHYGVPNPNAEDLMTGTLHELGHAFKLNHQNTCTSTSNDQTVMQYTYSITAPQLHLTRADRRYYRIDYGYMEHDVREAFASGQGFPPATWPADVLLANDVTVGPLGSSDSSDSYRGIIYNENVGGNQTEPRALLYEPGGWLTSVVVSNWDGYYRPDITRTIGLNPEVWMAAFLANDSPESINRQVFVATKPFGASAFGTAAAIPNATTTRTSVAVAFDPIRDYFVVVYLDGVDRIVFRTLPASGTMWSDAQQLPTSVTAFDGVDVACHPFVAYGTYNCTAAYVSTSGSGTIRHFPFRIDPDASGNGIVSVGSVTDAGLFGFSRPSVTTNPLNADPRFLYAFNQAGESQTTIIYMRTQNRDSTSWSGATPANAPSVNWFRPASLGTVLGVSQTVFLNLGDD